MSFQNILRYSNAIHHHPVRILSHFLAPGTSKVCTKDGVVIGDVRSINRSVLDHVVAHHTFEVSLIWMAKHSLDFASNFISFLVNPSIGGLQTFLDSLYEVRVLGFLVSMYDRPISYLMN